MRTFRAFGINFLLAADRIAATFSEARNRGIVRVLSGDSYLQDEVPEIDIGALEKGVRIFCLTAVEDVSIKDGTHSIGRFGLSAFTVRELLMAVGFMVLTAITKHSDERMGYFVSLIFDGVNWWGVNWWGHTVSVQERVTCLELQMGHGNSYQRWKFVFRLMVNSPFCFRKI